MARYVHGCQEMIDWACGLDFSNISHGVSSVLDQCLLEPDLFHFAVSPMCAPGASVGHTFPCCLCVLGSFSHPPTVFLLGLHSISQVC